MNLKNNASHVNLQPATYPDSTVPNVPSDVKKEAAYQGRVVMMDGRMSMVYNQNLSDAK